jgi:hypothetical protein
MYQEMVYYNRMHVIQTRLSQSMTILSNIVAINDYIVKDCSCYIWSTTIFNAICCVGVMYSGE